MEKPENTREYILWWNKNFDTKINLAVRRQYDDTSTLVKYKFEHSDEYNELIHQLHNYEAEYRHRYGYDLLMKKPEEIELKIKNWQEFMSKVWRKNVVHNIKWKYENWNMEDCQPKGGWITPANWFEKIHDIVRTRIVVKYFDGVELLLDKMHHHFEACGCQCEPDWEAREEGYYAAHLNVTQDYELPVGLAIQEKRICVEIQITTQMKDVITSLTHKYYERKRESLEPPDKKWQWDYDSDEFSPNYIGHVLHYIEGTVMQIRDKERANGKR